MTGWRDHILAEFAPGIAKLILAADPDGLLLEEGVLEKIEDQGFSLIPFEDHIEFRFAFESRFRSKWDFSLEKEQAVVVHVGQDDLQFLPYDLLQAGRKLYFSLGKVFPNLSYPVLAALDKADLDALYQAQKELSSERFGDRSSKDFVLRHVYSIAPEMLKKPADLLRILLSLHYKGLQLPEPLQDHLIEKIERSNRFQDWPLRTIISDRETFFAFLQERWQLFVEQKSLDQNGLQENKDPFNPNYPGPAALPFEHHDVRAYLDNLFLEGLLEPVEHTKSQALSETWVALGVHIDPEADRKKRLEKLYSSLVDSFPDQDARHGDWLAFAKNWAELLALWLQSDDEPVAGIGDKISSLQLELDDVLTAWMQKKLGGLINLPPVPPVMLHHIPRFLARSLFWNQGDKIALLVLDGLSFDQWVAMRKVLTQNRSDLLLRENAVFAWTPSTTAISRQALFAGRPPVFFPDSIHTTNNESHLWQQFWVDQGVKDQEVMYARGLGNDMTDELHERLVNPQTKVAGLVVNKVDKIMHGMQLGLSGMHNQIRQWAKQPFLNDLLDVLLQAGYQVVLTSDHGNIQASGCGRPAEGALAETRGERVRIFRDSALRDRVSAKFPQSITWSGTGLPEGVYPLLAPHRRAFVSESNQLVCHGGISLEELVVPLVQIERK